MRSGKYPAPWGGEVYSVVARAFVAKPEDFGTANPTLWDSVESDGLDPGPTTSSALHESRNSPNFARNVNTNSLNRARNPSFSGDFLHAIALPQSGLHARAEPFYVLMPVEQGWNRARSR